MRHSTQQTLVSPLLSNNPIAIQFMGICSALAVTTSLLPTLTMCLAVISVACMANVFISLIRHYIPRDIRIIIQITVISSFVIVVDQVLKAYAYEISQQLSVFVGLIITNCIVLARTENFAMNNSVGASFLDGLSHGAGYSLILIVVAGIRELLGAGTLLGKVLLPLASDGGWYHPNGIMLMAPSGFFIIGLLVWLIRSQTDKKKLASPASLQQSPE